MRSFPGCFARLMLCLFLLAGAGARAAQTPVLQVAAAADLAVCLDELNAAFTKTIGDVQVKSSIGSSGNFFAQIKQGAPFDVFLSADTLYPQALAKENLADAASLMVYAHGQLVMWSSDPAIDVRAGFAILSDPAIKRIAIANPDVAPYGRAAKAALEKAGMWEAVKPRIIMGENVAQTAQFVETGNAQIGFVGAGHVRLKAEQAHMQIWRLPAHSYPTIEQGGIVTAKGQKNPLAQKYLDFLRSATARAVFRNHGFVLPGARD